MLGLISNLLAIITPGYGQDRFVRPGDYETLGGYYGNRYSGPPRGPVSNSLYRLFGGQDFQTAPPGGFQTAPPGGYPGELPNPIRIYNLLDLLARVINILKIVAAPIVVIMILWGAFLIISAAGDSSRAAKGGKTILWATVGFAIVLLADGIVAILQSALGS